MANSNKPSYLRIGFTVLIGAAAIVGALIYIGGLRDRGPETLVETYCTRGVGGLSKGSAVKFRGVKIGEVREITFVGCKYDVSNPEDSAKIYILMALSNAAMGLDEDESIGLLNNGYEGRTGKTLRAKVSSSGITGLSHIDIDVYPLENATPPVQLGWKPEHIYVPAQVSLLDSFSDSATKVMNQINRMDLNTIASNVAVAVDSIARATDSLKVMMEVRQADLEKICDDFAETASSVKAAAAEIQRNPSVLIRDRRQSPLPETSW